MPRRGSRRLRTTSSVALALCVALGCKPDKPVTPDGGGKGTGGGGDGAMTDIAPVTRIAEMLPASTVLVWELAGPDRIAEVIGRDALVQKFQPQYRKIADELVRETGRDLLDPKELADIGMDTKGHIGLAMVSMKPLTFVAFATLKDKGRFRRAALDIAARAKTELAATPLGHAEILRHEQSGTAIVIREPYVAVVFGARSEGKSDPAFDLATMDPMRSLAVVKGYKKGTGGLSPSDALFYMDGGALAQALMDAQGEAPPVPANWARDELVKARQSNATPERIKELEQQVKEVDEQNARWIKRQQGERELFEQLFGGIQASVWTADAKPGGIVGQGTTTFAPDSPMLLAIENGTGSPPLARALDGKPLFMVTGKANVEQLLRLADLFAQADGTTWSEVAAEIARETGIDPERDLKPLVTGQAGFAVTRDGESPVIDDPKQIGGALYIEVHDPKGAQAVLAKAAKAIVGKDDVKVRKAGDGWVIDTKEWRKLYVDIQGPHLVISTDPKLVARIAGGKDGSITKSADGAALAAASLRDSAAGLLFDPELTMMFFMGRSRFDMGVAVESPEDAKVPKSRAWKAKERELVAVKKKLDKAQDDRAAAEMKALGAVVAPWGSFGASARRDGNSIVVQGGWFVRSASIASAISESLEGIRKLEERQVQRDDASALFEQRMKLENELQEIRRADLEKFRARKAR